MSSALLQLARQVYESLPPPQLIQATGPSLQQTSLQQAAAIQSALMEQYGMATNPKQQAAVIQAAQSCAVHLADTLDQYIDQLNRMDQPKQVKENLGEYYRQLKEQLIQLVNFLHNYYGTQCNPHQRMPAATVIPLQQSLKQWAVILQQRPGNTQQPLTALLASLIQHNIKPGISYQQYTWWKQLYRLIQGAEPGEWQRILIRHNFNDPGFIDLVIDGWEEDIADLHPGEAITAWAKHELAISRIPEGNATGLYPDQLSCRQLLLSAIRAETMVLQNTIAQTAVDGSAEFVCNKKPIKTSLTITQLAGMVRLLVQAGVVTCDNQTVLLRNITTCFAPRNGQSFTSGSLRQKYYQQDPASVNILKSHLSNMQAELRNF
jgi:hypothetical protein